MPPAGSAFADGAAPMSVNWELETAGTPTITQTALGSGTTAANTNGFAAGSLSTYSVTADGTIEGVFTSGATAPLGQVAVATFANIQGLANTGNNNYQPTYGSGSAVIGIAGTAGRGTISGGYVEESNVNIATEFAKLIVAQQAYSANAKSITSFNQVSQATIAMIQ
jgi:flagellar hook protein FlgE